MPTPVLRGKRVLVVGLARTGVATARFLASRRALVTVTDRKRAAELAAAVAELNGCARLALGGHARETFLAQDLIVLSPGVPEIPELAAARAAGVAITGEIELCSRFAQAPVIAITGTNGKSTVTSLVGRIMAGTGRPTFAGANLGTPLAEAIDTPAARAGGVLVLELSSFQLETAETFHPRVAALLNVTADHLDRYPSMAAYAAAKARVFAAQDAGDFAVVNADDPGALELARGGRARVLGFSSRQALTPDTCGGWVEGDELCLRLPDAAVERYPVGELNIIGRHNLENALAAYLCSRLMGATPAVVRAAGRAFQPLRHRMELVRELGGVRYYDDSKGTNVGAVAASLEGFPRRVVLIAGGRDKGGDYGPLRAAFAPVCRGLVLIGEAAARIEAALAGVGPIRRAATLEEAVVTARALAQAGDAVVLSPACSSYDMFRDYQHRADVFCAAVKELA
ncbi:MAG TPA: UDP-N-acetylmuramoyl-L-alanine--D-glutamate ligase [Polyangia bacterium]